MSKKNKKNKTRVKKIIVPKDKEERLNEVITVIKKINNLGLNDNFGGVKQFTTILKQFVNDGIHKKGKIDIKGAKRQIVYSLPENKGNPILVELKYVENNPVVLFKV